MSATPETLHWVDAGAGYQLALDGEKLVCKNAKGKVLASVPKDVREGEMAESLIALREWLENHAAECRETVETWMLRSLPVPRAVLAEVFADAAWRVLVENAVVAPVDAEGEPDLLSAGFLRAADAAKGLGIVDLDGETRWLTQETVLLPHPILLGDLHDFRTLAGELELNQGLPQLFRETSRGEPSAASRSTRRRERGRLRGRRVRDAAAGARPLPPPGLPRARRLRAQPRVRARPDRRGPLLGGRWRSAVGVLDG